MRYRTAQGQRIRHGRCLILLIATLAVSCSAVSARPKARPAPWQPRLQVLVYNYAGISDKMLSRAEDETAYLLNKAGAGVEWIDCSGAASPRAKAVAPPDVTVCSQPLSARELILSIQRHPATHGFGAEAAGYSKVSVATGRGSYAGIFYDRVVDAAIDSGLDVSEILGGVAAHEIGHLLLGVGSHSPVGIMRATWTHDDLRKLFQRRLRFTPEQGERMRAAVLARTGSPAALRASNLMPSR